MNELVSVEWLYQNLNNQDLIVLDTSLATTIEGKTSELQLSTIPNARYFDLKGKFSNTNSPFPNTVPSAEQFELEAQKLGINQNSKIVVFDNRGVYSSPRVWWLFKTMGHEQISVLDGGLPEWLKNEFPTEIRETKNYELGNFKANFQKGFIKSYEDIVENIHHQNFTIIDARSEGRFKGAEPEPRKHLKSGHIPNSINIPYTSVLEDGKFKSKEKLQELFKNKELNDQDLVFSCGSGLTACIVMLANELVDSNKKLLFDGSWTEWAERQGLIN